MIGIFTQHQCSPRRYIPIIVFWIGIPLFLFSVYMVEWSDLMTASDTVLKTKFRSDDDEGETKSNETTLLLSTSSCLWEPFNNSDCIDLLSKRISLSLNVSRANFLAQRYMQHSPSRIIHRRWLFLGDSTVIRSFNPLQRYLVGESLHRYNDYRSSLTVKSPCYGENSTSSVLATDQHLNCSYISTTRCDTMEKFHLQRLPSIGQWKVPIHSKGEGPIAFGRSHPYCTDCSGCNSHLLSCRFTIDYKQNATQSSGSDRCTTNVTKSDNNTLLTTYLGPSYGGYIAIEFARDVELQTLEYNTTQENALSNFIASRWNAPIELLLEFGRPICVVSAGHHDAIIKGITKELYLQNVQWYLEILQQQCDYIIWVSNNCPLTDDYPQKINATYEWNIGVRDLLLRLNNKKNPSNVFFLDVYNASQAFEHHDNIHMSAVWYAKLSSFLKSVMKNLTQ